MVRARPPVAKTVIRPLPPKKYCHSSALGCQCSSGTPPGLTVTIAAAIFVATLKVLESMMRTSPLLLVTVGAPTWCETQNQLVKGQVFPQRCGDLPRADQGL